MKKGSYHTHDAEAAHDYISTQYIPVRVKITGSPENFAFKATFAEAGDLRMDFMRHTMGVANDADPFGDLTTVHVLRGPLMVRSDRQEIRLAPGDSVLYPFGVPLSSAWQDVDLTLFRVPLDLGRRVAAEITGLPQHDFRVLDFAPRTPALGHYWAGLVRMLSNQFASADSALANPLVAADMAETMTRAMLRVFPTTVLAEDAVARSAPAPPAAIRRATSYIDERADQPLTLTAIARAAGLSPRALQLGFSRYHGDSPMAYLRRVRLDRAHRDLEESDPQSGTTVATIATRWGFSTASHFTQVYRQAYGRLPSQTLRH